MILTLLIAAAVATGPSARAAKPGAAPTGGTLVAMQSLEHAYQERDLDRLDALYSADYEYISVHEAGQTFDVPTFYRDNELESARNLFRGVMEGGTVALPPAKSIDVTMKGLSESADPEHPDSANVYRLVVCKEFGLTMKLEDETRVVTSPSLHVFQLVRGDVAMRTSGQTADPKRWYIRRWVDDANGVANALAKIKGDCTPQPVPIAEVVSLRMAIQPLGNPACPTIDVMCTLPNNGSAVVEVFDVQGRRVNKQTFQAKQGAQTVHAGAGATVKPGAYFVRVTQGKAFASQKVLVAQ